MRCNLLYISSDVSRIASAKPSYESRELHQVTNARDRAPLTHDDFGIRRNEICPLPGYRADGLFVDPQQEPHAGSVAPLAHAQELLPPQWMERVRYAHKTRRSDRRVCNLSRVTNVLREAGSAGRSVKGQAAVCVPKNCTCCCTASRASRDAIGTAPEAHAFSAGLRFRVRPQCAP